MTNLLPNDELSLETLTAKLTTLLALVTAQRVQTLSKIDVKNITIDEKGVIIRVPSTLKTSAVGRCQPSLILPAFTENLKICPVHCLKTYLKRTEVLRRPTEDGLLITFKKPHKRASPQTISRWIKQTLIKSGIDTNIFTAHSTRHAATSAAAMRGIDVETIRRTAGWTEKSEVFAKFYHRPILTDASNFANAILNRER